MAGQSELIDGCSWWHIGVPFPARLLVINSHVQSLLPMLVSMTYVLLFMLLFKETAVMLLLEVLCFSTALPFFELLAK